MSEAISRSTVDLISDCVHCGFCLPACPTYVSWGDEADSPRGRIDLMKGLAEGAITMDARTVEHFDRCLGCMGCMTACPSGVRYDLLIESTKAAIDVQAPRSPLDRLFRTLVFAIFTRPARLRALAPLLNLGAALGLNRFVRGGALLPRIDVRAAAQPPADQTAARGTRRARVGLLPGCVQQVMFPQVNAASVRVLAAEGCDVTVPADAGCCGALSLHSGRSEEAKGFARALIERFEREPLDAILTNVAGCGSTMKGYGELLAGEPAWAGRAQRFSDRVRDINEFLAELGLRSTLHRMESTIAYHDACHLAHAQRIRQQPRDLLRAIPGVTLAEIPNGEQCCGSAGTYNLFQPDSAREIGERKAGNVAATGAHIVASANPGCTLQIQMLLRERGVEVTVLHPVEILDAAIRGGTIA
jgi:glycolate oxidase iron-sulfur subunit